MAGALPLPETKEGAPAERTKEEDPQIGGVYKCQKALRVRLGEDKTSERHPVDDIPTNTPFIINQFGDNPQRGLVEWDSANGVRQKGWVSVVFPDNKYNLRLTPIDDPEVISIFRTTPIEPEQKDDPKSLSLDPIALKRTSQIPNQYYPAFPQDQDVNQTTNFQGIAPKILCENISEITKPLIPINEFSKAPPPTQPNPTNGGAPLDQLSIAPRAPGVPNLPAAGDGESQAVPKKRAITPSLNGAPEEKKPKLGLGGAQQGDHYPAENWPKVPAAYAVKSSTPILPTVNSRVQQHTASQPHPHHVLGQPHNQPGPPHSTPASSAHASSAHTDARSSAHTHNPQQQQPHPHGRPRSRSKSSPPPEKRGKNNHRGPTSHHGAHTDDIVKRDGSGMPLPNLDFKDYDARRYRGGADDMFSEDSEAEDLEGENSESSDKSAKADGGHDASGHLKRLAITNDASGHSHRGAPGKQQSGGLPAGFDSEGFREFIRSVVRRTIHAEHVFKHGRHPQWDGTWRPPKPGSEAAKYIKNLTKKCTTCEMVNAVTNMIFHQEQCRKFEQADIDDAKERVIEKYVQRYMRNH